MKVSNLLRFWAYGELHGYIFRCPACDKDHVLGTHAGGHEFNGNVELPTFQPSVVIKGRYHGDVDPVLCHSMVRNGVIEFLPDSTHALSGKTVPLPACM